MSSLLSLIQDRCGKTDCSLLAVYATGISLHLPYLNKKQRQEEVEFIAIIRFPALATYTDKLTRVIFDGALPTEHFIESIHSKDFWEIGAPLCEVNSAKLALKEEFQIPAEQKAVVRFMDLKEFCKLATSGTCEMIDLIQIAAEQAEKKEPQDDSTCLFESDEWKLFSSSVLKRHVSSLVNLQWMKRSFGVATGSFKHLKFGSPEKWTPESRRRLFCLTFHRLFNVFEFLSTQKYVIKRISAPNEISMSSQEFLSGLNSFEKWMDTIYTQSFQISLFLEDVLKGGLDENVLFNSLESNSDPVNELIKKLQKGKLKDVDPKFTSLLKLHSSLDQFLDECGEFAKRYKPRLSLYPEPSILRSLVSETLAVPQNVLEILSVLKVPIEPYQVLFLTQSGSFLYDLATKSSDKDYMIIFSHLPSALDCVGKAARDLYEDHVTAYQADKSEIIEFSANEIDSFFCMIMKGNPRNLEPLFASEMKLTYESPLWKLFKSFRESLLSTRAFTQYMGFILDRIMKSRKELEKNDLVRSSKYLYHAHHKLFDLIRLSEGKVPRVTLSGAEKDAVMEIRTICDSGLQTEDLKGFIQEKIYIAEHKLEQVSREMSELSLPKEADFDKLFEHLKLIRYVYQCIEQEKLK